MNIPLDSIVMTDVQPGALVLAFILLTSLTGALATSRKAVATPLPLTSALGDMSPSRAREGQVKSTGRCRGVEVLGHNASAARGGRAGFNQELRSA